jgi:hypothetical protein
MTKLIFGRVEAWLLWLVVLLGLFGMVAFGGLVLLIERGSGFGGTVGRAAHDLAAIPLTLRELSRPDRRTYAFAGRFDGIPSGWSFAAGTPPKGLSGYLLLSRLDGDRQRHAVELLDLSDWTIRHVWLPDADQLLVGVTPLSPLVENTNMSRAYYRAIHPFLLESGGLVIKDQYSTAIGIDACAQREWFLNEPVFSHSTEMDADGDLWMPAHPVVAPELRWKKNFRDDSLVRLLPDGQILETVSMREVVINAGKSYLLFPTTVFDDDPLHVNDIQPVLADGPHWKEGDLFVSMRGPSLVLLYRPSTGKIIWMQAGPWLKQHDVDILDDHRISIFSNNTTDYGTGPRVDGHSEVMIYDFDTGEVTTPWSKVFAENDVETTFEGLADTLPGGYLFVEEANSGRLLLISPAGELVAQYINRASDGQVYRMGWSRYIAAQYGGPIAERLEKVHCDE